MILSKGWRTTWAIGVKTKLQDFSVPQYNHDQNKQHHDLCQQSVQICQITKRFVAPSSPAAWEIKILMFDSKLTAIRWIQLQCNREEAERPGALQNRTIGGQPPCPRRLAVKSDFKTSLYEMIMIFCLLSVKHTWGNVDVDEQT